MRRDAAKLDRVAHSSTITRSEEEEAPGAPEFRAAPEPQLLHGAAGIYWLAATKSRPCHWG